MNIHDFPWDSIRYTDEEIERMHAQFARFIDLDLQPIEVSSAGENVVRAVRGGLVGIGDTRSTAIQDLYHKEFIQYTRQPHK